MAQSSKICRPSVCHTTQVGQTINNSKCINTCNFSLMAWHRQIIWLFLYFSLFKGDINIFRASSFHILLQTTFGLKIHIQHVPVMQVYVSLEQSYRAKTRGEFYICFNMKHWHHQNLCPNTDYIHIKLLVAEGITCYSLVRMTTVMLIY